MDDAKKLWDLWQGLLVGFRPCFTRRGWVRFEQWVTATVLGWEEHTITQELVSVHLEDRWRAMEAFAERGAWDHDHVERQLDALVGDASGLWDGYAVSATDDTKLHRTSEHVWGVCTFHEYTSRCPNRAETVRAHNWVTRGRLVPGQPWWYVPTGGRLYFRQSQLPAGETFRTKSALAVAMAEAHAREASGPCLEVFDGGYALSTVVRPLLKEQLDRQRIEVLTRLRLDARLYYPLSETRRARTGRPRKWGRRMAAPKEHESWHVRWQAGHAWVHGRRRRVRWKQVLCQWHVAGPERLVHAIVADVEGEKKAWYMVCSALDLSGSQVVEAYAARYRQEDGHRDMKQRMGVEECRAWTKEPILRTFQVQTVAMALLRLLQFRLDAECGEGTWWSPPAWNPNKTHPSILDVRRCLWRCREAFSQLLSQLDEVRKHDAPVRKAARSSPERPPGRRRAG